MKRHKDIVKVSLVGVGVNLILVAIKATVGFLSGSVAILSDAMNNFSDAISSIVTIIGTMLARKKPDKEHPYGHGKIEHVTALAIGLIIFGTGISLILDSVEKIINPELADYDFIMLFLIFIGVLAKLWLGLFVKEKGEKLKSEALVASGKDALFDVLVSSATLIGAIFTFAFGITIDGWIGIVISALILRTAIEIVRKNLDYIIGTRIDAELSGRIKKEVAKDKKVLGAYDLVLHQYGPEMIIGSIHIEVNDELTAKEIHILTKEISERVFEKFGVLLTIGIYASNTGKGGYVEMKKTIQKTVKKYPNVLEMHGFYVDKEKMLISFDLVFDFMEKESEKIVDEIKNEVEEKYPKYRVEIVSDSDFAD